MKKLDRIITKIEPIHVIPTHLDVTSHVKCLIQMKGQAENEEACTYHDMYPLWLHKGTNEVRT